MPFTEKTLALANMCLVIHVMGKLFNILKQVHPQHTHTQLLQKHAINRYIYMLCTYNNIMSITNMYSTFTMLDIVLYK